MNSLKTLNPFHTSSLGAILVIAGVLLGNAYEELEMGKSTLAPLLFVAGWALSAYAVAGNSANTRAKAGGNRFAGVLPYVAAAMIVGAVMTLKAGGEGKMIPVGVFIAGWLLFVLSIRQKVKLSLVAVVLVFISMLVWMPKQRKLKLVNGPTLVLFTIAWIFLIWANSSHYICS